MNPSTALARALLARLVEHGVRDIVLSPGSRSAPLAFAAARLDDAGAVRLHVRFDERSAGFLALGLAKVSGAPVGVICTSGTAVANLTPAVVEASYSAVPLVVVTADRPVEARGVGAPQTIDQVEFFGPDVRFFADLGAVGQADPDDDLDAALRAARVAAGSAVGSALGASTSGGLVDTGMRGSRVGTTRRPGPVHLNVGFRLPLVPDAADLADAPRPVDARSPGIAAPSRRSRTPVVGADPEEAANLLGEVPARGVLVVGDLPPAPLHGHHRVLAEFASACGWPIIAEPSANLHWAPTALSHGVLVLGAPGFLAAHRPDLVVTAGLFGLSRPTLELMRVARRHVAIDLPAAGREVCDPVRTACKVLEAIPRPPSDPPPDAAWLADWTAADAVAAEVVGELAAGSGWPGEPAAGSRPLGSDQSGRRLSGAGAAMGVWRAAPADGLLLVAASWPVRQVEAFAGRRAGLLVVGNRGANGIDGLVSTAWGAALAHQSRGGGPALALLGDLAFLHDHNGLLVGAAEPQPDLVIVVSDNDGGGIFHQLEQGRPEYAASFERLFGTPLGRDLVSISAAAGVPACRVANEADLADAVRAAMAAGGVRVVVADVRDRAAETALLERVRTEVSRRLG
ncbi:MAG: 2-succinyl-5-enolpyruvyl-6-hydroxy-3-cyclohexene-1-carboxylic-acid synthase [Candidatus Nanopelagicales bacterium]